MSKRKNLVVLLIVFVAVLAAYFGISAYSDYAAQKKEEREQEESEANRIWITNFDEVKEISYDNGTTQLSFVKEEDEWKYKDAEDFPLAQSYLTALEDTVSHLEASRKLEGGDELESYGLDEPQATVTVTDAEGEKVTLEIGDSVNSEYYLLVEGEETPYTVSSTLYNNIQYELYDMIEMEEFPDVSEENILSVEVTNESGSYMLEKLEAGIATAADATMADATPASAVDSEEDLEEQTESSQTGKETKENSEQETEEEQETEADEEPEYEWYLNENGKRSKIENESLCETLLSDLSALSFENCENYKASDEELKEMGLSEPKTSFTVKYEDEDGNEAEFTVFVGNLKEDDEDSSTTLYYARLSDSKSVNTLKETVVSDITGNKASDYLEED